MKKTLALLALSTIIGCQTKHNCPYNEPANLNDGLKVSTLEKHNLQKSAFEKANHDICSGKYGNIHSVLIIHNNELVVEQYYNGWDKDKLHFLASTTKSFSPLLIGMAIEKGMIKDVGQKMVDFFPHHTNLREDSLKSLVTLRNLLTNSSGFEWDEQSHPIDSPKNMGVQMDQKDNWLEASLDLPMDTTPGTRYTYSGPNNIILGEIIKNTTGQNIADFAADHLFKPLGIKEFNWFAKNGIYDVGGGLKLKSRDIAKFALLHLNKGKWLDQQIVSSDWISETFRPYIEIKDPLYSCYQWLMMKTPYGFNSWFIPGNGGQIINIVPDLNLAIIINADNRKIKKEKRAPLEHLIIDLTKIHPRLNEN